MIRLVRVPRNGHWAAPKNLIVYMTANMDINVLMYRLDDRAVGDINACWISQHREMFDEEMRRALCLSKNFVLEFVGREEVEMIEDARTWLEKGMKERFWEMENRRLSLRTRK